MNEADPARRVRTALAAHGLADRIEHFDEGSTKSSRLAAAALGCELGQVIKSLVFVAGGEPVLVLVAGDRRGDAEAIAREMGAATAELADADAVRRSTGYAVGGVSPFDLPSDLAVLVDDSLSRFDVLYAAAGTAESMVGLDAHTFIELAGGRVARISRDDVA